MQQPRVHATLQSSAEQIDRGVYVGQEFVFIDVGELDGQNGLWTDEQLGAVGQNGGDRCVVSLSECRKLSLPGVAIHAAYPPTLRRRSLTTDRDLYRRDADMVHALVVDLDAPNAELCIGVISAKMVFELRTVRLNQAGIAIVKFSDLPIGNYKLIRGRSAYLAEHLPKEDVCEFSVAGFELAPLVATLRQLQLLDRQLAVQLNLMRFGDPFSGAVRVDLFDGSQRIDSRLSDAQHGVADVELEIQGNGPHRLELVLTSDRSATATIPLPGSSRRDREETILSRCGPNLAASLLPGVGTTETLGLHVRELDEGDAPIRILDVHRQKARLVAGQEVEACSVMVRAFGRVGESVLRDLTATRLGNLKRGDECEIELPPGAGILSIGGFVDGQPWEARAVTVRPAACAASIRLSSSVEPDKPCGQFEPGASVKVAVAIDSPGDGFAAITVRDARLQSSRRPTQNLASQIKAAAEEAQPGFVDTRPLQDCLVRDRPLWMMTADVRPHVSSETLAKMTERGLITQEQADDVRQADAQRPVPYYDALIQKGYADAVAIARAIAEIYDYAFVELENVPVDSSAVELCPESVARENCIFPLAEKENELRIAMSNPFDLKTIDKLRFILNRRILISVATPEAIRDAIDTHYGYDSDPAYYAESFLQEFTDTAIDFTDTMHEDVGMVSRMERLSKLESSELVSRAPKKDAGDVSPSRDEADVLCCELVEIRQGLAETAIALPDRLGQYAVDVFVVSAGEWSHAETSFAADADPYVDLQLPEALFDGDRAVGRIVARCASDRFQVEVLRNGEAVSLFAAGAPPQAIAAGLVFANSAELTFVVDQGTYVATVRPIAGGRSRQTTKIVRPLGKTQVRRRVMRLLFPHDSVCLGDEVQEIRLLPSCEPFFRKTAQATADYEHLCCEQTAAKLFASFACLAGAIAARESTEAALTAIRAGLRREQEMWLPHRGFASYPGRKPCSSLGKIAARHLAKIELFGEFVESEPEGVRLLAETRKLTQKANDFYRLQPTAGDWATCGDAYLAARRDPKLIDAAQVMARSQLQIKKPRTYGQVYWREDRAFALATLLLAGDAGQVEQAVTLANELFDDLGPTGRLYSTVDSTALIVMLLEMSRCCLTLPGTRMTVNDQPLAADQKPPTDQPIRSLRCDAGRLTAELNCRYHEDWTTLKSNAPISVRLKQLGQKTSQVQVGSTLDLHVKINDGYELGDLIWIALPPALSRLEGGGQVKQFTIDPQGDSEVVVRLAATAPTYHPSLEPAEQHFVVCLRNMYEEQRVGNQGLISIRVDG